MFFVDPHYFFTIPRSHVSLSLLFSLIFTRETVAASAMLPVENAVTQNYMNGDCYVGSVRADGKRHGQGTYFSTNGDHYEGAYVDGKREGQGQYFSANGDRYKGEFKNSQLSGQGTEVYKDGSLFEGLYKEGKKDGPGQWFYANGDCFVGLFKNGERNGQGTLFSHDGTSMVGLWMDDNLMMGTLGDEDEKSIESCAVCGKPTQLTCAQCQSRYYCSRECQKQDWKGHKVSCVKKV